MGKRCFKVKFSLMTSYLPTWIIEMLRGSVGRDKGNGADGNT